MSDPKTLRRGPAPLVLFAAAAVVIALGLGLWFLPGQAPPVVSEPASTATADPTSPGQPPHEPPAAVAHALSEPLAEEPSPADPLDDPASAASAHAAVAAELNLVAIRCPLPPDLPTQAPVGAFRPQVVDGWLSDVVMSLKGERGAELRFGPADGGPTHPDVRFELAYIVSWEAQGWGEAVRCRIERIGRGDLVVTLVGDGDVSVHGIEVYGCGERGTTDGGRVVFSQVLAGKLCPVWVRHSQDIERCVAEREVTVPAGGRLEVSLELRCGSLLDPEVQAEELAWFERLRAGFRGEAAYEMDAQAEIELFSRLRAELDEGTAGADLYDGLIAHRRSVAEREARAPALIEAMTSGDREAADAALRELLEQD